MPTVWTAPLRRLAITMATLRVRVREALAGEVARAVSETIREVVDATLRGDPAEEEPLRTHRPVRDHWDDPDDDPWEDHPYRRRAAHAGPVRSSERENTHVAEDDMNAGVMVRPSSGPAAVTAGVSAGRWWLKKRGSMFEAVGVGLLVGLAVLAGGPIGQTGAVVVSAAADLTAATEALGAGASRLQHLN